MKRTLFYIFILSLACLNSMAQDAYYYYCGEKVPLKVVEGKVAVRTAINSHPKFSVYSTNEQIALEKDRKKTAVQIVCFETVSGKELISTEFLYVKLRKESDEKKLEMAADVYGLEIVNHSESMPLWYMLRKTKNNGLSVVDTANRLFESGEFDDAFPDFAFNGLEISYDPDVHEQWGLYNARNEGFDVNVSPAWNYSTGKGVKIAIVDDGIDWRHQDLEANVDYNRGLDATTSWQPGTLYGKHGTHCAGIAAAVRNNGKQISGVAPDAKLIPINVDLIVNEKLVSALARGINWAWRNGADVISCSWWCPENSLVKEAIDSAVVRGRGGKGCIIVKSAGNNYGPVTFPGNCNENILVVAAAREDEFTDSLSNYGEEMFVMAPGNNILSTLPNDELGYMTGTSMAAPYVAGVAALILERNPDLTAKQVREIIARTAKKVGKHFYTRLPLSYDKEKQYGLWNQYSGYGLVDAYNAVLNTPRN